MKESTNGARKIFADFARMRSERSRIGVVPRSPPARRQTLRAFVDDSFVKRFRRRQVLRTRGAIVVKSQLFTLAPSGAAGFVRPK